MNTGIQEKDKQTLIRIILFVLPDCKIYLFGSRAEGKHDIGSDIDIAIDDGSVIDLKRIFLIKEAIEETNIPQNVDVVDFHSSSDLLRQEVKEKGIIWKN